MEEVSKKIILDLVSDSKLELAINKSLLFASHSANINLNPRSKSLYLKLIVISGRYKTLQQDISSGVLEYSKQAVEISKITGNFVNIISDSSDQIWSEKFKDNEVTSIVDDVIELHKNKKFEYDIFLSYTQTDSEYAEKVCTTLMGIGFDVFLSKKSLKKNLGGSYFRKINEALTRSKDFLLISSPEAMTSEWVQSEYESFYNEFMMKDEGQRILYVLKAPNFSFSSLPLLLRRLQIADSIKDITEQLIQNSGLERNQNVDNVFDDFEVDEIINDIDLSNEKIVEQEAIHLIEKEENKVVDETINSSWFMKLSHSKRRVIFFTSEILLLLVGLQFVGSLVYVALSRTVGLIAAVIAIPLLIWGTYKIHTKLMRKLKI